MDPAVERLERWLGFGGSWRVVDIADGSVTIALLRCDGGEKVDELASDSAALRAWLGAQMER